MVVWGFRLPIRESEAEATLSSCSCNQPRDWELSYEAQLWARHFGCCQESAQKTKNAVGSPSLD